LDAIEPALRTVSDAVAHARIGFRADEQDLGLTAGGAIANVESAAESWFEVATALDRACEEWIIEQPRDTPEIRACQSALMLLQLAVVNELTLVQPLETLVDTVALIDALGWPTDQPASLATLAFSASGPRDAGLVALLYAGTDDGPDPEPDDSNAGDPATRPGDSGVDDQVAQVGISSEDDDFSEVDVLEEEVAPHEDIGREAGASA
jgi:hypothetical protein